MTEQSLVSKLQQQLADLQTRIDALEGRLAALELARKAETGLQWVDPFYWIVEEGQKVGPYCRDCYGKGKELVRLSEEQTDGHRICPTCRMIYKKPLGRFDSLEMDPHFNG